MNVVTQFRAAREHDEDRAARFRALFEGAAVGIAVCQCDGCVLEANSALRRMFGYGPSEQQDSQETRGARTRAFPPGVGGDLGCRLDPEAFLPDRSELDELLRGERASVEIEKCFRRQDGSDFWGHLTVSLGCDARRQPAFLIAMLADATERHRVEEHLRDAEKMEVIGRMAGGIAHDFNNLLTGVLLYCDLLSAGLENAHLEGLGPVRSGLSQQVQEVRMAGEQGAALTRQLLLIARKQTEEPRPIRLDEIVASTEDLLRRLIGEHIELAAVLDAGAALVLADPVQLRQILLNLVLNARDAMPGGGSIQLSTHVVQLPGEGDFAKPRRAVSLVVKDNGCGMDAETRARMFEPLFTTKGPGKGTGFGLATVQRIVSEVGGTIEVESEPEQGTSISVFFPVVETLAASPSIAKAQGTRATSSGS
jgi:two-component system cell cycle sensor histidine kinase/response regulator CckA